MLFGEYNNVDYDTPDYFGIQMNEDFEDEFGDNVSKVVLTLKARDLKDADLESVSDPYCVVRVVSLGPVRTRKWKEVGRTEVINNCLDPDWATKITMPYNFEDQQKLLFEVFDKGPVGKCTRLGSATVLLHEIVSAQYNRVTVPLREDGKQYGSITITAEELTAGRQESVYFICSASGLDRKDFLGKCDPFLKVSRINHDGTLQLAFRTRYKEQNLAPKWKPFEINMDQLCYRDRNREFFIECYDWDADGNHDLVGSCKLSINYILKSLENGTAVDVPLVHHKKARKSKKYTDSGILHIHKLFCWYDFTFLDFVQGGTELDFTVAVDFTKSNLPLDDSSSLHRIDPTSANQYEIAIRSIAEICQYYNQSKVFNAYGFGAQLPNSNKVMYNFPLNVESGDPRCEGIQGLLNAYRIAQRHVLFAGPTDFAPTIKFAAKQAAALPHDGSRYHVLLIITDGVITNIERTKEQIVKASSLPLSIIIVGVGYDSFEEMKVLDSDNVLLSWNGKYAKRDIVQFVQIRNFLPPHRQLSEEEVQDAKRLLAKEVLQEIPMQLTGYMKSQGIFPLSVQRTLKQGRDLNVQTMHRIPFHPDKMLPQNQHQLRKSPSLHHDHQRVQRQMWSNQSAGSPRLSGRNYPQLQPILSHQAHPEHYDGAHSSADTAGYLQQKTQEPMAAASSQMAYPQAGVVHHQHPTVVQQGVQHQQEAYDSQVHPGHHFLPQQLGRNEHSWSAPPSARGASGSDSPRVRRLLPQVPTDQVQKLQIY